MYIVVVSFIGGGSQSIGRKPDLLQVTDKLDHNNVVLSTPRHEQDSNSQH